MNRIVGFTPDGGKFQSVPAPKVPPGYVLDQPSVSLDVLLDQVERERCENAKGLDGTATLSGSLITLQIHNPSAYALKGTRVEFVFTPTRGSSFTREYDFQGSIPKWSDGAVSTNTNVNSRDIHAMRASVVDVSFEKPQ
jgi:hypothetical protein